MLHVLVLFFAFVELEQIPTVGGVCNCSALSHRNKNLKWRTDQCYSSPSYSSVFFRKQRKIHHQDVRAGWPKRCKEQRSPWSSVGSSFFVFSPPLRLSYVTWASRRAVCFTRGSHSSPQTFLCSVFAGFSLLCLLAAALLDSFFLF